MAQAPELTTALAGAPAKLRHLAEVPFNTRLIYELLQSGVVAETLQDLASQAQLLRLFWDLRRQGGEVRSSFVGDKLISTNGVKESDEEGVFRPHWLRVVAHVKGKCHLLKR